MAAAAPAPDKPRKPDTEQRVRYTEKLIARQLSGRGIAQGLMAKFGIEERTARTYIAIAYQRLQESASEDRGIRKAQMRRTLQGMLRHHMAKGDRTAANRAVDMLCRLDGLYAPEKLELSGAIGVTIQMRQIINVLDADGLEALQRVLDQCEAAGIKALPPGDEDQELPILDIDETGELVDPPPAPVARRAKKSDAAP